MKRCPRSTGLTTHIILPSHSRRVPSTRSISKSGRRASSFPAGYKLGLTVRGRDDEYAGPSARLSNIRNEMRGCGPFLHNDPRDRPQEIFGGRVTIHTGPQHPTHLLLPIIPQETNPK